MNKNKVKISVIILIALTVITLMFVLYLSGLGNGYRQIGSRSDDIRIVKDDKVIVNATIVDYKVISSFVVGLRLPAEYLECGNGGYRIIIKNKRTYFVLSTESEILWNFLSKEEFNTKLKQLNIIDKASLDYSKFEYIWNIYSEYYKNIDYSTCKTLAERP